MKFLWSDCSYLAGSGLAGLRKTTYKLRTVRALAEVRTGYPVSAVGR
jgi:hypothetical protein